MDCLSCKRHYTTITLGYCFQNIIVTHQGEALEHVLDVAADGSHGGDLLLLAKPFLDLRGQNEKSLLIFKIQQILTLMVLASVM